MPKITYELRSEPEYGAYGMVIGYNHIEEKVIEVPEDQVEDALASLHEQGITDAVVHREDGGKPRRGRPRKAPGATEVATKAPEPISKRALHKGQYYADPQGRVALWDDTMEVFIVMAPVWQPYWAKHPVDEPSHVPFVPVREASDDEVRSKQKVKSEAELDRYIAANIEHNEESGFYSLICDDGATVVRSKSKEGIKRKLIALELKKHT